MQAYVFTDAALAKRAGQFAWLAINTDEETNAAFSAKYPTQGVPSFLLIDPKAEKALQTWYGTITVAQLNKWLDDGLRAVKNDTSDPANAALARADKLNVERKPAGAIAAYREAITAGGAKWPGFSRAVESMMLAYELGGRDVSRADCASAAMEYAPKLPRGQSFVNAMRVGIKCGATEKQTPVPGGRPQVSGDEEHLKVLVPLAEQALKIPQGFADDKGEIYATLYDIAKSRNDEAAEKKYATEMWAFLEQQFKTAPNAEARASLDSWRMTAARFLGDPALALPALQASERDLPKDYNPPARLASIYTLLGRLDDALAANARAVSKASGSRKAMLLAGAASLLDKKGDRAAAKKALEDAIHIAEGLPAPAGPQMAAGFQKQLQQYK